jgi:hypothetical protein
MLKERVGDQKALAEQGKVVLVPPYTAGEWKGQASLPALAVAGNLVSSVASTAYIVVTRELTPQGLVPGDRIIFDAAGAPTGKVGPFIGQSILLRCSRAIRLTHDVAAPEGLFLGRMVVQREGTAVRWVAIVPRHVAGSHLSASLGTRSTVFGTFTPEESLPAHIRQEVRKGTVFPEFRKVVPGGELEALAAFELPESCEILGRFTAIFSGETGEAKGDQ